MVKCCVYEFTFFRCWKVTLSGIASLVKLNQLELNMKLLMSSGNIDSSATFELLPL